MLSIVMIGAGNMASNLANAFLRKGVSLTMVYSRTEASARRLGEQVGAAWTTNLSALPQNADVYIYAVKDAVLGDVLRSVDAPEALHLHTAGSMGLGVFGGTNKPRCGVLYPFQTVSKDRLLDFEHIPVFVESGRAEDLVELKAVANILTNEVYEADSEKRSRLHLAGVFANNFVNCMYAIGGELLQETGLPEKVLLSLIDETAQKVHQVPAREAQTGPAVRDDKNVMQKHLEMLGSDELREIYKLLSANIHKRAAGKE